jgi:shikimate dehydrogenase
MLVFGQSSSSIKPPSGETKFYAMIGTPIEQVKSPKFFNAYFKENGIDAVMQAIDLAEGEVEGFFKEVKCIPNFEGCIVTVPHKNASAKFMDEVTLRARQLESVNAVRYTGGRLIGDMVDGLGFLVGLKRHGLDLKGKRVAVIGCGSAGAAVARSLARENVRELVIQELSTERYPWLRQMITEANPDVELIFGLISLAGFDLIANVTPVGMNGDPNVPFPMETLESSTLVMDAVSRPQLTPWLAGARARGCDIMFGSEMILGQFGLLGRHMGLDIPDPVDFSEVVL